MFCGSFASEDRPACYMMGTTLVAACQKRDHTPDRADQWLGIFLLSALVVLTFYPGVMTNDSRSTLEQARTLELTDWHPPILALIWHVLDRIAAGPILMLVAQAALYATAITRLCASALPSLMQRVRPSWLLIIAVGAFPPAFAISGMMWKDIWMSSLLMLGLAMLIQMSRQTTNAGRYKSFLLLVAYCTLATAFRHNAAAATAGLLAGGVYYLIVGRTWLRHVVLSGVGGLVLAATMVLGVSIFNRAVATPTNPTTSILLHDIAGTILRSDNPEQAGRELLSEYSGLTESDPAVFMDRLKGAYSPDNANGVLRSSRRKNTPFDIVVYDVDHDAELVREAWSDTIRQHPVAYLRHRASAFRCLLQLCDLDGWKVHSYVLNPRYIGNGPSPQAHLQKILLHESLTRIYSPALWLGIVMICLVVGLLRLQATRSPAFFMALSGVGLAASLFPTVPIDSFRYMHWPVLVGWTATLMTFQYLVCNRGKSGSARRK